MSTTTTYTGVRIVDMPDLGAFTASSSVVGERAGSGRFSALALRQYVGSGVVNVLDLGAMGDGSTDDTAAIQSVLTTYAGRATVFVPDTGSPYMCGPLNIPASTDLLLHGTILARTGSPDTLIRLESVDNVTIRGHGVIDGNRAVNSAFTGAAVSTNLCNNICISGITIQNAVLWNLNVVASSHVRIDGVSLIGGKNSNQFAHNSDDCWLTNSLVDGPNSDGGFCFYGGVTNSGAVGNVIRNAGVVDNARMRGLYILADVAQPASCRGIVLANNIIHNCSGSGIFCNSGTANYHHDILIANNQCHDNGSSGTILWNADIGVDTSTNVVIIGNQSIRFGNSTLPQYGIHTGGLCTGVSVIGNTVSDVGVGGAAGTGLYVDGTNILTASGNHFYNLGAEMNTAIDGTAGAQNAYVGNLCDKPIAISLISDTIAANYIQGTWVLQGQNYSFSRDQTTHAWNFVDGANTNLTVRTDGEIIARTNIVTTGGIVQGLAFYSGPTTQVLGNRIAGWGTSTGGVRAPVTAGSTLPQVAAALSQLLTDLGAHGMIGP